MICQWPIVTKCKLVSTILAHQVLLSNKYKMEVQMEAKHPTLMEVPSPMEVRMEASLPLMEVSLPIMEVSQPIMERGLEEDRALGHRRCQPQGNTVLWLVNSPNTLFSLVNRRGRGVLQQQEPGMRVPVCGFSGEPIRWRESYSDGLCVTVLECLLKC